MKPIRSDWTDIVLVCRKCAKKLDGGFGPDGKQSLPKALRAEIARREGAKPQKKPRRNGARVAVVEVSCLDICPKNAVVTIASREPGCWHLVREGEDVSALLDRLAPRDAD
ncbi:(2Fe-2S) ferredoxin domain-containing protein [Ancylobacter sp. A5.8]|uniref:(2Fe-2S) ferredoxin domain-containing protein n=1 Tax=Ancylobacter gelatini TaxID=2919920 RepID=UPI001F4D3633|nr:(2Fe-2S) ferredoxin domain-containing protein [Ancylobacter gelatini]MCJ8143602.1 (2Fe-2S) ferredoxin domain-containing protein [Ancylobacter gelatini]